MRVWGRYGREVAHALGGREVGTSEAGAVNGLDGTIVWEQDLNTRVGDVFVGMEASVMM
jgi:hypothetical protein